MRPLLRQLLLLIHGFVDITITFLVLGFGLNWEFAEIFRTIIHPTQYSYLSSPLDFIIFCLYRFLILLATSILIRCDKSKKIGESLWLYTMLGVIGYSLAVSKLLVFDSSGELQKHPKIYLCAVVAILFSITVPCLVWYVVAGQKSTEPGYENLQEEAQDAENGESDAASMSPEEPQLSTLKQFWQIAKICTPHWKIFTPAYASLIAHCICAVFIPLAYSRMILVVVNHKWDDLVMTFGIGLLAYGSWAVCRAFKTYYSGKLVGLSARDLRRSLFFSLIRQPMSFFDVNKAGALVSRIKDSDSITDSLPKHTDKIVTNLITLLCATPVIFYYSWQWTLATLVKLPLNLLLVTYYGGKLKKLSEEESDASALYTGTVQEVFTDMREVRALGGEEREQERFSTENEDWVKIKLKKIKVTATSDFWLDLLGVVEFVSLALYGAYLVKIGRMTSDDYVIYGYYNGKCIIHSWLELNSLYSEAMETIGKSRKVVQLLNRVPEIDYTAGTVIPDEVHGHVVFDEVEFAYPTRSTTQVLNGLSLSIEPGMTVALVGPSGNGKSTIVSLLEQFYHPNTGNITLDNIPIQDIDHQVFRTKVALVAQDPTLFSGTVRDNIKYGLKEDVDDEEVIRVATMANVHEFVSKMEKGYDTLCGVRGVQMSGGQKQRIAIARALIRNPKVLILDEATSALDAESEHLVQEALTNCAKGISVLVIAHRLSTIRNADKIAVIEKGRVMELGNHDELMLNPEGTYFKLVQRQTKLI